MSIFMEKAIALAVAAHAGQVRKYTGEPYVVHPISVMGILANHGVTDPDVLAASVLHDTAEDTLLTLDTVERLLNKRVATLVCEVTDVSVPGDGDRATRKTIDRDHLAMASNDGKAIKLADMIDNTRSIVAHDPNFAKVYLLEMTALLGVLHGGNDELLFTARRLVVAGLIKLDGA